MSLLDSLKYLGKSPTSHTRKGYISLTSRWKDWRWFLHEGHVLAHIWDRLKWHYCPKLFIVPDYPCHLEVEASAACQMRCPMCAQAKMYERGIPQGNMDWELYKKIIDEAAGRIYSIKLSWRGEPALNPHLFDMVRYAKEKGIKSVAFLTNFERFDKAAVDELLTTGVDYISISVDGMKDNYERIRYPAKFETQLENIGYLHRRRGELGLKRPLIRIQSIYSAIKDDAEAYLDTWDPVVDKVKFIADQWRASMNEDDYDLDPDYVCPTPFHRMAITFDGRVAQCKSDESMQGQLGDLRQQSIHEVWHGEPFQRLREAMKTGRRLEEYKACRICTDGAKAETGEYIKVKGRELPVRINAGRKYRPEELDGKSNRWKRGKRKAGDGANYDGATDDGQSAAE